jgi:excisionase family DNA binding protein
MMKEAATHSIPPTPILFPYEPEEFWKSIRLVIREELKQVGSQKPATLTFETPGLTYKPLYKITEVCELFHISKPTIYDWVRHGKLKPLKIRSRVYFLWQDIQQLMTPSEDSL